MANTKSHCSRSRRFAAILALSALPLPSIAQQGAQQAAQQQGYALERFYPSGPGAGWFVMDDLNISGGIGGAIALTTGYAHNPLVVASPDGSQRLALVSGETFMDVGAAVTYSRFRFYLNIPVPLSLTGTSGTLGAYQWTAPSLSVGTNPDSVSDPRLGFDARLFGRANGSFRLGTGAQLIFPSGARADYVSDARYRAMFRALVAGDVGRLSYAGQFGIHLRPAEGLPLPGSPNGNEFLFGAAAGRRFVIRDDWNVVVGPEFFGESAIHSNSSGQTGFEGLLTTRLERTGDRPNLRFRIGIGHSLIEHFGAPQWRILGGVELSGRRPDAR